MTEPHVLDGWTPDPHDAAAFLRNGIGRLTFLEDQQVWHATVGKAQTTRVARTFPTLNDAAIWANALIADQRGIPDDGQH